MASAEQTKLDQSFREVCEKNGLTHFNVGYTLGNDAGYEFCAFAHRGGAVEIAYGASVNAALSEAVRKLGTELSMLADEPLAELAA